MTSVKENATEIEPLASDGPRLIEVAFPLKQASIDSVHEKNVRHGHISTLHIWPARRPLAACRAALIATLLPDPGDPQKRKELLEKIGGRIVKKVKKKKLPSGKIEKKVVEETEGGILHWGRETENKETLDWFRDEIKKAYGGRAPRVLDPFAGGGAIPLEAMRLGCEVTAVDINPVAWFILKCTLEYPQKLAGQKRPLPEFVLKDREFMESFFKAQGLKGAALAGALEKIGLGENPEPHLQGMLAETTIEADLAWHVRAWGWWVLEHARKDLARFYPTYADFEPLKPKRGKKGPEGEIATSEGWAKRERIKVPIGKDGKPDLDSLNAEFTKTYLSKSGNPRWVAKPTVAYLWARTVECKNCRATIPLLKTRWLCKKDTKRVLLTIEPNKERTEVVFGVQTDVPVVGGNAAQRRENDKKIGQGTMSRNGVWCPCCGKPGTVAMTMEDIRQEGMSGRLGATVTAVVVDGQRGKQYRIPTKEEIQLAADAERELDRVFSEVPFGLPTEPLPDKEALGFRVPLYGFDRWYKLFTPRQLMALGRFLRSMRRAREEIAKSHTGEFSRAIQSFLCLSIDRLVSFNCSNVRWKLDAEAVVDAFARFALPIMWDFAEAVPINSYAGAFELCYERIALATDVALRVPRPGCPEVNRESATTLTGQHDFIFTDPPYYDAIPYSDLMDFFYVWLRRMVRELSDETLSAFNAPLSPKWDHVSNDGELIDDASRFGGDKQHSKAAYEDGMSRAFVACARSLKQNGRLVIVFAHKNPHAWETLVSAIIRAGFVVDGSWPIQTEMGNRTRALSSAALASSVWLVCKKRPEAARPGWDNNVLDEMREKIYSRLRDFWEAGIRGPDFVWAATGPALEAYSRHPVVKKANEQGEVLTVSEFLRSVRRIVVDFVVGRVLSHNGNAEAPFSLDDLTTYYLLHRHDFGMLDAPIGACILYAISCGLSDSALADQWDVLVRTGGQTAAEDDEEETSEEEGPEETEIEEGTGSKVKLKPWNQRKRKTMGYEAPGGRPVPLIDQIHRLMHLWRAGDVVKVDEYLDARGLRKNAVFHQLLQALIELAPEASEERSTLESISNHVAARGVAAEQLQRSLLE